MSKAFGQLDSALSRELKELSKRLKKLSGIELRRAHARVINTIARKSRVKTLSEVSKELGIKNKDLRYTSQAKNDQGKRSERMKISRATANNGAATLSANAKGIPLIKLKTRQTKAGVKAGSRRIIKGAFIATPNANPKVKNKSRGNLPAGFAGKAQVFKRKGKSAYPLKQQYVSVSRRLKTGMEKHTEYVLTKEAAMLMKKELEYRIAKLAGFK